MDSWNTFAIGFIVVVVGFESSIRKGAQPLRY
jgi:hypothetical protein